MVRLWNRLEVFVVQRFSFCATKTRLTQLLETAHQVTTVHSSFSVVYSLVSRDFCTTFDNNIPRLKAFCNKKKNKVLFVILYQYFLIAFRNFVFGNVSDTLELMIWGIRMHGYLAVLNVQFSDGSFDCHG